LGGIEAGLTEIRDFRKFQRNQNWRNEERTWIGVGDPGTPLKGISQERPKIKPSKRGKGGIRTPPKREGCYTA